MYGGSNPSIAHPLALTCLTGTLVLLQLELLLLETRTLQMIGDVKKLVQFPSDSPHFSRSTTILEIDLSLRYHYHTVIKINYSQLVYSTNPSLSIEGNNIKE